jgi:DNA polymerase-3 subunit delta'
MSWQGIEGHDAIVARFRTALGRNRLASALLFVGPPGIGKRTFALKLAQTLLCERRQPATLDPCGECRSCALVLAGNHPDLLEVRKAPERSSLPVELFIGPRERRMQEGLCHAIRLKPFMGGRRVALIDDADFLNDESANCLLKTLEEPPPHSVLILIGTSPDRQLPTIRSRTQLIRFEPLAPETIARLLVERKIAADPAEAQRLASYAEGSLARAQELAEPELCAFRSELIRRLIEPAALDPSWAKAVVEFIDAAGKEASARRARGRQVLGFAIELYRQLARALVGAEVTDDDELRHAISASLGSWAGGAEAAGQSVQRTLEALDQLERNAHQPTLIEGWLDDLVRRGAEQLAPGIGR